MALKKFKDIHVLSDKSKFHKIDGGLVNPSGEPELNLILICDFKKV